jgi:hypothetical protein
VGKNPNRLYYLPCYINDDGLDVFLRLCSIFSYQLKDVEADINFDKVSKAVHISESSLVKFDIFKLFY